MFNMRRPDGRGHGNRQVMHNGSRIIKMAVVATPNVRRRRQTDRQTERNRDTKT